LNRAPIVDRLCRPRAFAATGLSLPLGKRMLQGKVPHMSVSMQLFM
jgi:hypothetical protein